MDEKFFTTEQVANILQVHPFTILKFIKEGKLKGIKLGRVYRIKESDINKFLEDRMTHGAKQSGQKRNSAPNLPPEGNPPSRDTEDEQHYDVTQDKKDEGNHYYII